MQLDEKPSTGSDWRDVGTGLNGPPRVGSLVRPSLSMCLAVVIPLTGSAPFCGENLNMVDRKSRGG